MFSKLFNAVSTDQKETSPVQAVRTFDSFYVPIIGTAEGLFQMIKKPGNVIEDSSLEDSVKDIKDEKSSKSQSQQRSIDRVINDLATHTENTPFYDNKETAIKKTQAPAFFLICYKMSLNATAPLKKFGATKLPRDAIQSLTYYTAHNKTGIEYDLKTGQPKIKGQITVLTETETSKAKKTDGKTNTALFISRSTGPR